MNARFFTGLIIILLVAGCARSHKTVLPDGRAESQEDVISALSAVTGAVSGQTMKPEQLKKLGRELNEDPEARKAVEAMSGALTNPTAQVKYCPVDGKRFSPKFSRCPDHNVELKNVE